MSEPMLRQVLMGIEANVESMRRSAEQHAYDCVREVQHAATHGVNDPRTQQRHLTKAAYHAGVCEALNWFCKKGSHAENVWYGRVFMSTGNEG